MAIDMEGGDGRKKTVMPNLPKPLTLEEKKYLLAVERGDIATVRRILQKAHKKQHINMNCVDPLGRSALSLAIDGENLEMVELLIILGVQTKDSLLQAINVGFVEAVELLLEHEELIHKEGEPYSWEKVDRTTSFFTPDITPLILAAHRNNYEILKILLDRGATLPMPHDLKCGCEQCIRDSEEDYLRYSLSRINEYKALASPSLIALSSSDPILTAFQLSWDLRNLAFAEQENKTEYLDLRRQCQALAVSLLDQTRSTQELAILLNHDPDSPPYEYGEQMKLARLELAIFYKQKKFVAHPNIQQLLGAIWYDGLPGFRRKSAFNKLLTIVKIALMFPFYCMLYMVAPNTSTAKLMKKPFMKFLIHASSYLFFLFLLILVSQRAELSFYSFLINTFASEIQKEQYEKDFAKQRGNGPMVLEIVVVIYVLGFIWEETEEMLTDGINKYLKNMWNFIDFSRNSLYVAVFVLRCAAYIQQWREISENPATAYVPREEWDAYDPQLIAEGMFAAANVFSALKLVHVFSINHHLGPLQISLGRMVIDIVKFFSIYSLVLFAFACGLNQLLWYFAELERKKCYSLPGGLPDWDNKADACSKWRSFGNLFESSQSLFWASFGNLGIDSFELTGIKTYTRFWGLLMFGSYSVINVIVLLNLLIAMMSNSYTIIVEHSDTEWKFARTKLWMSYFEDTATLPPPFNIFPNIKSILKLFGLRKKDKLRRISTKRKEKQEKERDYRYTAVMRSLVWRYISAMQRQADDNPITEDDVNEIKGEITTMRYEFIEVLKQNGLDVSSASTKDKSAGLGKKMKVWERRLMKDFHLAPVAPEEEMDFLLVEPPPDEDVLAKFRRIAKLAVLNSAQQKWGQVVRSACKASQIGHCNSRAAYKNQQCLQKAMKEAEKFVSRTPKASRDSSPSMVSLPDTSVTTMMELLNDFAEDDQVPDRATKGSNILLQKRANLQPSPNYLRTTAEGMQKKTPNKDFQGKFSEEKSPIPKITIQHSNGVNPIPPPSPTKTLKPQRNQPEITRGPTDEIITISIPMPSPTKQQDVPKVEMSPISKPPATPKRNRKIEKSSSADSHKSVDKEPMLTLDISNLPKSKPPTPEKKKKNETEPSPKVDDFSSKTAKEMKKSPKKSCSFDSQNSNNLLSPSTSTSEPLIPSESPRHRLRKSDPKQIKRQPKDGWL